MSITMEVGAQSQEKLPKTKRKQHIEENQDKQTIFNKERHKKVRVFLGVRCYGFGVFRVFRVFKVNDILKGQKG